MNARHDSDACRSPHAAAAAAPRHSTGSPIRRASRACRRTSPGSARFSSASSPTSAPTSRCARAPKKRSAKSSPPAPRRHSDHAARQRHRQLRPVGAAARRRDPRHERLQRLRLGPRRYAAGRRPASALPISTGRRGRTAGSCAGCRRPFAAPRSAACSVAASAAPARSPTGRWRRRATCSARASMTVEPEPRVSSCARPRRCCCITSTAPTASSSSSRWRWRRPLAWLECVARFDSFDAGAGIRECAGERAGHRQEGSVLSSRARSSR